MRWAVLVLLASGACSSGCRAPTPPDVSASLDWPRRPGDQEPSARANPPERPSHSSWVASSRECIADRLRREFAPLCTDAAILVDDRDLDRDPPLDVRAEGDSGRCGLQIEVSTGWIPTSGWTLPADFWVASLTARGFEKVDGGGVETSRNHFGLRSRVAVETDDAAKRSELLVLGQKIVDACVARPPEAYREFRLTLERPVERSGSCARPQVGLRTLIVLASENAVQFEYAGWPEVALQRVGDHWVAEVTYALEGPLHACGPKLDCGEYLGSRTIRWQLDWDQNLRGEVDITDRPSEPGNTSSACHLRAVFRGSLVSP
jgi:hypothetical protein